MTERIEVSELTRQQLCSALSISESTVRRLELAGLPNTPIGLRGKRYNLDECKCWLRAHHAALTLAPRGIAGSASLCQRTGNEFSDACRKMRLRVMPSK